MGWVRDGRQSPAADASNVRLRGTTGLEGGGVNNAAATASVFGPPAVASTVGRDPRHRNIRVQVGHCGRALKHPQRA
jgi:hypothetical protein